MEVPHCGAVTHFEPELFTATLAPRRQRSTRSRGRFRNRRPVTRKTGTNRSRKRACKGRDVHGWCSLLLPVAAAKAVLDLLEQRLLREPVQLVLRARGGFGNAHLRERHLGHIDERHHAVMLRHRRRIDRRDIARPETIQES